MSDLVGADLQVENGSQSLEATPAPTPMYPAEPGTTRDALGNVYAEPRQGNAATNPAGGTAGTQAASTGTDAGQELAGGLSQPPRVDPAYQQAIQAAQAANMRAAQAEARTQAYEQASWEQRVRALPVDQQRIAIAQRQMELTAAQSQQAAQRQAQQQQALEPLFKEIVVTKLAQQYANAGVTQAMLSRFSSPEAMEEFCRAWATDRRVTANTQRQVAGVDRAATAGVSSRPAQSNWKGMSLTEQLSAAFE